MSSINQSSTQPQQPIRGRTGDATRRAPAAVQRMSSSLHQPQAMMQHQVESLVVSYLDQNPNFIAGLLQRHESFLAMYLRAQYNIVLPARMSMKCPAPTQHPPKANVAVAKPQSKAAPPANLPNPHTTNYQRSSAEKSQVTNYLLQRPSAKIPRTTNYQLPNVGVSQVTSYQQPSVNNGDSPQSTSSQPSSNWPSEEDLSVPYPAPRKYLEREVGLNKGKGNKWSFDEQDLAIECMFQMRDDPTVPRTEKRFEEVSRIFKEKYGLERSKDSVKNMWNRIGRQRSQYDERKNKSAPLATSHQRKQARMEQGAKRKRKVSADPEHPVQKKSKPSSMGSKPSSMGWKPSSMGKDLVSDAYAWGSMSSQEMAKSEPEQPVQKKWKPSSMANESVSDAYAWVSMSPQEMAKSNALFDAELDALFSTPDDQALPQFIDPRDIHYSNHARSQMSSYQGMPPATKSAAFPGVPPNDTVSQIQPPASGIQDGASSIASSIYPELPTVLTQLEQGPSPDAHYTSNEDFAKVMMAELENGSEMDEFGQTDGFFNACCAY